MIRWQRKGLAALALGMALGGLTPAERASWQDKATARQAAARSRWARVLMGREALYEKLATMIRTEITEALARRSAGIPGSSRSENRST